MHVNSIHKNDIRHHFSECACECACAYVHVLAMFVRIPKVRYSEGSVIRTGKFPLPEGSLIRKRK